MKSEEEKKKYRKEYRRTHREQNKEYDKQYYENNKEQIKERYKTYKERYRKRSREYYETHKEQVSAHSKMWHRTHKEQSKKIAKKYRETYKEQIAKQVRDRGQKMKLIVINHYGTRCRCCNESRIEFLNIDHIGGGGTKHRKQIKRGGGREFYRWLIENNFPKGFRVLCYNCNMSRGHFGYCPHEKERVEADIKCDYCDRIMYLAVETVDKNYKTNTTNRFVTYECSCRSKKIFLNGRDIKDTKYFKSSKLIYKKEEVT